MFQSINPKFEKGRILKSEMLESIRDFPRSVVNIMLEGETNGIVTGAKIEIIEEGTILIQPGILLMDDVIYVSQEAMKVQYHCNNQLTYLKVKCGGETREKDYNRAISQIVLEDTPCKPDELELCRFKLREGAKLRGKHTDFNDLNTEFDTINRIHASYVCNGTNTLAPEVLLTYVTELVQCQNLEAMDYSFCFLVKQNKGYVDGQVVQDYLVLSGMEGNISDRLAIYQMLENLLQQKKQSMGPTSKEEFFQNAILLD